MLNRKTQAHQLLSNPLIQEFFESYQLKLFNLFRAADDNRDLTGIWMQLRALKEMQVYYQKIIMDGQMVEKDIEQRQKKATK